MITTWLWVETFALPLLFLLAGGYGRLWRRYFFRMIVLQGRQAFGIPDNGDHTTVSHKNEQSAFLD